MSGSGSSTPTSRPSTPTTPVEQPQPRPARASVIQRIGQAEPLQTQGVTIPVPTMAQTIAPSQRQPAPPSAVQPLLLPPISTSPPLHPRFSLQQLFAPPQMLPHWYTPMTTRPSAPPQMQAQPTPPTQRQIWQPWSPTQRQAQPALPQIATPPRMQLAVPLAPRPLQQAPVPTPSTSTQTPLLPTVTNTEALLRGALDIVIPQTKGRAFSSFDPLRQTEIRARAVHLMGESLRLGLGKTKSRVARLLSQEFNIEESHTNLKTWAKAAGLSFEAEKQAKESELDWKKARVQQRLFEGKTHPEIAKELGMHPKSFHRWYQRGWIKHRTAQDIDISSQGPIPKLIQPTEYSALDKVTKNAVKAKAIALFKQGKTVPDVLEILRTEHNIKCKRSNLHWWDKEARGQTRQKAQKRASAEAPSSPAPKFQLVVVPDPKESKASTGSEVGTSDSKLVFPAKLPPSPAKEDSDTD